MSVEAQRDVVEVGGMHHERMSYAEWAALPAKPKAEWVDGWAVWSLTPPDFEHGWAQGELRSVLRFALPDLLPVTEVDLVLGGDRIRIPDVSAVADPPADGGRITEPPVIVAEVLSPSTTSQDTVEKAYEYAAAGVGQYWILDPDRHTVDVYERVDAGWTRILRLTQDDPVGTVVVTGHGNVALDVRPLFRLS